MKLFTLLFIIVLGSASSNAQSSIFLEDFEDAILTYTSTPVDDLSDISNRTYFGRITSGSGLPTAAMYDNKQGGGFYSAEDTDGSPSNGVDFIVLDFDDIDISGKSMIEFCVFLAEDPTGASEHWDGNTSVRFLSDIDNTGTFQQIFAVESSAITANTMPRIDANGDGIGEGAEITGEFTQYCFSIAGTGSLIDLKVELEKLNSSMEDIAIDNIELTAMDAAPPVDPIPTMGQWALFILALMMSSLAIGFIYNSRKNLA